MMVVRSSSILLDTKDPTDLKFHTAFLHSTFRLIIDLLLQTYREMIVHKSIFKTTRSNVTWSLNTIFIKTFIYTIKTV